MLAVMQRSTESAVEAPAASSSARAPRQAAPAAAAVLLQVLASAGYGLWMLLGLSLALGLYGFGRGDVLVPLVLGCALVSAGLVAAVLRLRAVPAWHGWSPGRSAWPSRDALAALAVYLPMLAVAGLARGDNDFWATRLAGAALVLCSAASMVYSARGQRPGWPSRIVAALYSGGLWLWLCMAGQDPLPDGAHLWILALLAGALALGLLENAYWQALDLPGPPADEPGRPHGDGAAPGPRRLLAALLVYGVPCLGLLATSLFDPGVLPAALAALSCLAGRLIEQCLYAQALARRDAAFRH